MYFFAARSVFQHRSAFSGILFAGFLLTQLLSASAPQPCVTELFIGDPEFFSGDGGPATEAKFSFNGSVAVAPDGTVYFVDVLSYRIPKIDPHGVITTIAGSGVQGVSGDGGPALEAELFRTNYLAWPPEGSLYFVNDSNGGIRKISPNGVIESVHSPQSFIINGLAVAADGAVYFTETQSSGGISDIIRGLYRLESDGSKTAVAGGGPGYGNGTDDGIPALDYLFERIRGVYAAANGELYVVDRDRVMRIDDAGIIHVLVGNGRGSSYQDGKPALEASLRSQNYLAENAPGDLFISDGSNGLLVVRGGLVHRLSIGTVGSLASEETGILFVKDSQVFRLSAGDAVQKIAGIDQGKSYDPGLLLSESRIDDARRTLTDSQGRLYYSTSRGTSVYRTTLDGKIEIVAGGGDQDADDGVVATDAKLSYIDDFGLDGMDRLYMIVGALPGSPSLLLRVELNGTFTVLAGEGVISYQGVPPITLPATDLALDYKTSIMAVTPEGVVYFRWFDYLYERGLDGIARQAPFGEPRKARFIDVDREGRILLSYFDELIVYDAAESETRRYFQDSVVQGATAANGTVFGLSGRHVLRTSPDGHVTDMFALGAGFEFVTGQLKTNSGFLSASAITTNSDGDLFISDGALDRVFVIRDADTCSMERPYAAATLNGASFTTSLGAYGFAPGELVSVFGDFLGNESIAIGAPGMSSDNTWQTNVGGFEVLVDGQPAPIIFSRSDQAAFIIPNEVSGRTRIQYRLNGIESSALSISVLNASPGIFTVNSSGGGQAAALNQDSSINSSDNPADPGSVIVLYITGAGATSPPSQTGSLNNFPSPQLVEEVEVSVNFVPAIVEFAGPAPGLVSGVVQVNARIPAGTLAGNIPVALSIGGVATRLSPSNERPTISIQ